MMEQVRLDLARFDVSQSLGVGEETEGPDALSRRLQLAHGRAGTVAHHQTEGEFRQRPGRRWRWDGDGGWGSRLRGRYLGNTGREQRSHENDKRRTLHDAPLRFRRRHRGHAPAALDSPALVVGGRSCRPLCRES